MNRIEKGHEKDDNEEKIAFDKELRINNISWRYSGTEKDVLNQASLRINRGESIAIVGVSGAGKSTLADIILGLFKPSSGVVSSDGYDIFEAPVKWSRIVGYVPQSVFLIDDTIRANIAFGIPRDLISDDSVWQALKMARLDGFVIGLSEGLDTVVGERGVRLSGGQRQRIAIARALYTNPQILVLDEATSALDGETEKDLMKSIEELRGTKTLVIIAHRLSTIESCDKVYEVIEGNIVERDKDSILNKNMS